MSTITGWNPCPPNGTGVPSQPRALGPVGAQAAFTKTVSSSTFSPSSLAHVWITAPWLSWICPNAWIFGRRCGSCERSAVQPTCWPDTVKSRMLCGGPCVSLHQLTIRPSRTRRKPFGRLTRCHTLGTGTRDLCRSGRVIRMQSPVMIEKREIDLLSASAPGR
jgi:hypothetical protein